MKRKNENRNFPNIFGMCTGIGTLALTAVILLLFVSVGTAMTAPQEVWNMTYNASIYDKFHSIDSTLDGGLILTGSSSPNLFSSGLLVKTNATGVLQWSLLFEKGSSYDSIALFPAKQTVDSGYITIKRTQYWSPSSLGTSLVKIDSSGHIQYTINAKTDEEFISVWPTSDGGSVVAGKKSGYILWLIKFSSSGSRQWNIAVDGLGYIGSPIIREVSDGGYAVLTNVIAVGESNGLLVKVNSSGIVQWYKTFGGIKDDHLFSFQETRDKGFILAGDTQSYGTGLRDGWFVKTNSSGFEEWNKTIGGTGYNDLRFVIQVLDQGYAFMAHMPNADGSYSDSLIRTDSFGNELWSIRFTNLNSIQSVSQTSDTGFALAGTLLASESSDGRLIKFASDAVDEISPNTLIVLSGMSGNNNWFVTNVNVNLTADDDENGSGIDVVEYSFNNTTWLTYTGNFTVSSEGITTVYYRSRDIAGNVEEAKNVSVSIDKTKPSVTINVPFGEYFVGEEIFADWLATDFGSGISSVEATVPNGTIIDTATIGPKTFSVNATDSAGNEENKTEVYNVIEYYDGSAHIINGKVIDNETEAGIAGVKVSANATLSVITGPDGSYSFIVSAGDFNLAARLEPVYYVNDTIMISTYGREVTVRDIELSKKPTGNIMGSVIGG